MCGIAGFYHLQKKAVDRASLDKMYSAIAHRGPNAQGFFYQDHIGFAHARLAIIDLDEAANQPMSTQDKKFTIVFNGEVYNFKALRIELEKLGHYFQTKSDTEVVLCGFQQWKTELFAKLNGFFSLAIYDRDKNELTLARDRIGIKPLYYSCQNDLLVFASELGAIKNSELVPCSISKNAVYSYLNYQYLMHDQSIYDKVYKLLPGHFAVISKEVKINKYWDIGSHIGTNQNSLDENIAITEELLYDSVKMRLQSDVPLGAFLSGGTDSSLVSSIAQKLTNHQLQTFTIGFDVDGLDETPYAEAVAEAIHSDHQKWMLTAKNALTLVPRLPEIFTEPFADSSSIPTYLLSKMTREKVTVALSGDGGDELFWGYERYNVVNNILSKIKSVPGPIRNPLIFFAKVLPSKKLGRLQHFLNRYQQTGSLADLYAWSMQNFTSKELQELAGEELTTLKDHPHQLGLFFKDKLQDERSLMALIDISTYLPEDILTKVDRSSMSHGLEARVPLLDHRLVEHALSIPVEQKIHSEPKHILKSILRNHIPKALVDRPKSGFTVPLKKWMSHTLKADILAKCDPELIKNQGLMNSGYIQKELDLFFRDKKDNTNKIWTIYMFQLWLNHHT